MPSESPVEGGCACRRVRYRATSSPIFVHCCHCTWCQRETGSAFALNALIEKDRIELLEGDVEWVDTPTESGQGQRVARCPQCKVAVFSRYAYGKIGDAVVFVRVGTLDAPDRWPPDIHIYTSTKQPWVALPSDVPASEGFYKASELWPKESLDRRAALFEAVSSSK